MSDHWIAFLFSVGASAWIYSKIYRSSGGNATNGLVAAGGLGLVLYLTMRAILAAVF